MPMLRRAVGCAVLSAVGCSAFECSTDTWLGPTANARKKGIALDDSTLRWCASQVPQTWPNAKEGMTSIRLFKAWDAKWEEDIRESSWRNLVDYAVRTGAKVFVGTDITCDEASDDRSWAWAKALMKMLHPDHVMGLAIGNELELLQFKGTDMVPEKCVRDIWENGYLWRKFRQYVAEFDAMGFGAVPITSVFTGLGLAGVNFYEVPGKARVGAFLANATEAYASRFAFTWNFYPYFDPNMRLDAGTTGECQGALQRASCWGTDCVVPSQLRYARAKMQRLTGRADDLLWVGETGWSSPLSGSLETDLKNCPEWSSAETFQRFYKGFLDWDLELGGGVRPPDHAFWFTMRDAVNFGVDEHFGLITRCDEPKCKITSPGFEPFTYELFIPPGKYACGGNMLFNGWVWGGKQTCQNKCEMDKQCNYFSIWPHSHDNMYWCRHTTSCNLLTPDDLVVSTYRKMQTPETRPTTTEPATTTAAPTTTALPSTTTLPPTTTTVTTETTTVTTKTDTTTLPATETKTTTVPTTQTSTVTTETTTVTTETTTVTTETTTVTTTEAPTTTTVEEATIAPPVASTTAPPTVAPTQPPATTLEATTTEPPAETTMPPPATTLEATTPAPTLPATTPEAPTMAPPVASTAAPPTPATTPEATTTEPPTTAPPQPPAESTTTELPTMAPPVEETTTEPPTMAPPQPPAEATTMEPPQPPTMAPPQPPATEPPTAPPQPPTMEPPVSGECRFEEEPLTGYFWDVSCEVGKLGCTADQKSLQCRFCGGGDYASIPCPPSSCHFPNEPSIPYFWDMSCEMGKLGCWADGVHEQCRFCGRHPFTSVDCPNDVTVPLATACDFDHEPATPYFFDETCREGMLGCLADGKSPGCRFCGWGVYSEIECPPEGTAKNCTFANQPGVPFYWENNCAPGVLGCLADGIHPQCRFCAVRPFESIDCPGDVAPPFGNCSFPNEPVTPYFWDETCKMGMLGCWADGLHAQCRFCGEGVYSSVACGDVKHSSRNLSSVEGGGGFLISKPSGSAVARDIEWSAITSKDEELSHGRRAADAHLAMGAVVGVLVPSLMSLA